MEKGVVLLERNNSEVWRSRGMELFVFFVESFMRSVHEVSDPCCTIHPSLSPVSHVVASAPERAVFGSEPYTARMVPF